MQRTPHNNVPGRVQWVMQQTIEAGDGPVGADVSA